MLITSWQGLFHVIVFTATTKSHGNRLLLMWRNRNQHSYRSLANRLIQGRSFSASTDVVTAPCFGDDEENDITTVPLFTARQVWQLADSEAAELVPLTQFFPGFQSSDEPLLVDGISFPEPSVMRQSLAVGLVYRLPLKEELPHQANPEALKAPLLASPPQEMILSYEAEPMGLGGAACVYRADLANIPVVLKV